MYSFIFLLFQQADTAMAAADSLNLAPEQSMSFFELLMEGGVLMIPIFLLSFVAVYVIAERWRSLNEAQIDVDDFLNNVEQMIKDGDRQRALTYCDSIDKPLSRIITAGIRRLGRPLHDIEDAIHNAGKKETFHLEKRMSWLATISAVEPLLGFTGTVTGLIKAFMAIQNLQGNVNPSVLAGGVWEALITTAVGLAVGIVALLFYNYLVTRISRLVNDMERSATNFIDLLQEPVPARRPHEERVY